MRPRYAVPAALLAGAVLTACATGAGGAADQRLTVLAAASLTEVFEQIAADVEADHDGVDVELSFAGSSTIVQQVSNGAAADVIALAGEQSLEPLPEDLWTGEPVLFTTNTLQLAVPPGNPAGVGGLADLADDAVTLVVCQEQVPCGTATRTLLERHGLRPHIVSFEPDVRGTLAKVELGEADAGIVYRTDVRAAGGRVEGVDIPAADNVMSAYPVLTVSDSALADAFVEEVLSDRGQQHLAEAGFVAP